MVRPKDMPLKDWLLLNVKVNSNGCWEWQRALTTKGYGQLSVNGKLVQAHRLMWELTNNRKISEGMYILHSCHNRKCINPAHLREGTQKENVQDMLIANRQSKLCGEDCYQTSLKNSDVLKIIELSKTHTIKQIAEIYQIPIGTISNIISGQSWNKITGKQPGQGKGIARGESSGQSTLTEKIILEIVRLYQEEGLSRRKISEKLNIKYYTVCAILQGRNWGWLTQLHP